MAEVKTESALWDVNCQGVWKIFGASGAREQEILKIARSEGLNRSEIKQKHGGILAVANVDLQIAHGEILCIIGLSGSGKSTLIRHINRLIDPTAGDIWVGGLRINALSPSALRRVRAHDIGMVFQNMALLPHRTVRDNVVLGLELRGLSRERRNNIAEEKLDLVGLQAWADHMPHELSGGMQQRVGLARALAADPRVLLMDEPFSALDPLIRRQLQSLFIELSARMKKTTLFITHDIDEAIRVGNRIAVMHDGIIVQSGAAEDLVTRPANDYVADLVQGVSRLAITRAHTLMQPWQEPPPFDGQTCPQAQATAALGELVRLAVDRGAPIKIIDDGKPVGFITRQALLAALDGQGKRP